MKKNRSIKIAVLILALGILIVAGYAIYGGVHRADTGSTTGAGVCTQDALMCPDGSYVARSGPTCTFAACPSQASFTGILKHSADGFILVMGAPLTATNDQEVDYAMPLVFNNPTKVLQLTGKKVKVSGSFTEGATLSVEDLSALTGDAGDPTLGSIAVGQTAFINGVQITFKKVTQDNRCPADVRCIQAGWVTANVILKSDTDNETVDLSSNATSSTPFDSYLVSIASIKPLRSSTSVPDPASYVITFRVK